MQIMAFVFRATILNLVFHFLYIFDLAQSQSDQFAMEKEPLVKACGAKLADLLSQTCSERYYDNQEKRSDYLSDNNSVSDSDHYKNLEKLPAVGSYPFTSKRSVVSIVRSSRFKRIDDTHRIIQECCINFCTLDVLESFCAQ